MNSNPSFIQRLLAETPPFWIKVQIISLALLAAAGELAKNNLLPSAWYLLISGALGAVALVAQFAIKDTPVLLEAIDHPASLLEHLPEILSQLGEISAAVKAISTNNADTGAKVVQMPLPAADPNSPQPPSQVNN